MKYYCITACRVLLSCSRQPGTKVKPISSRPGLIYFSLIFFLFIHSGGFAQCISAPPFPGCIPSGATPLTDGAVINSGTTMYFSGTATFSNVRVSGGRLIVCGNLTVTTFAVDSGTVFINTGAALNYNGGGALVFGPGSRFYNMGTTSVAGHIILMANVVVVNDWVFSTPFNYTVIQGLNSVVVNNYNMTCGGYMAWIPSSPGCLCLGGNSWTTGNYFFNRTTNSVSVPSGNACLNIRQYVSNDNLVTANPGLNVCVPSGVTYSGSPNWGSATVNNNCNGCLVALPIELLSFSGSLIGNRAMLEWVTLSENNNCLFIVERSLNAIDYSEVGMLNGAINSTSRIDYRFSDDQVLPDQVYYYRLKQQDCDGYYTYSDIISLYFPSEGEGLNFVIHNTSESVIQLVNTSLIYQIEIFDHLGRIIKRAGKLESIDLSGFNSGWFLVKIISHDGAIQTYKIWKT